MAGAVSHLLGNFNPSGGSGGSGFGALAYQSAAGQNLDAGVAITWDADAYDVTDWHSTSTDTNRFTVDGSVGLIRLTSNITVQSAATVLMAHRFEGAEFMGGGKCETVDGTSSGSTQNSNNIASAILVVSGGWFETYGLTGVSVSTVVENTWASIEEIDGALKRVLAKKTANQAIGAGTSTVMAWAAEEYDTDGFHDNSTNNSRLTAPATGRYRVTANLEAASVAVGQFIVSMLRNGASARGLAARDVDTTNEEYVNAVSAVIELTAGDYIESTAFHSNAVNIIAGNGSWFAMEEVPSAYQCCLVYKSANQSITTNTNTAVAFGAEIYDDATMHDNSTNNSRIVVPAGCTRARPSFGLATPSQTGQKVAQVFLNGATYVGAPRFENDTAGGEFLSGFGAWVDVVPGDYFEVMFLSTGALTLADSNSTWFCLECQ